MATKKDTIDFKSAIKELEQISQWFQSEDIDLDEGLTKLKRAKELIAITKSKLTEVENEFNTLKKDISPAPADMIEEIFLVNEKSVDGELPF